MEVAIRVVSAQEVYPIRQRVLRAGQPAREAEWAGDHLPTTTHFGAYLDEQLMGIASVYLRPPPDDELADAWQVRGMATLPEHRGRGIGAQLLEACLAHIRAQGGQWAWCNARTPAVSLYERYGFRRTGDEFELPGIGPHYRMIKKL